MMSYYDAVMIRDVSVSARKRALPTKFIEKSIESTTFRSKGLCLMNRSETLAAV